MKPLRIQAQNCKAYRELDLDVSGVRHAVVIGANGAGKSLLIDLIRIALFDVGRLGPRALAGLIGQWGDTASVTLDFEHAGRTYRATRTRRNSGKSTSRTDVMQVLRADGQWEVTQQTAEQILGVSAATMSATTFLRSRGSEGLGDFGAASPEERRGILYDLRRANRYEAFEAAAKERASVARRKEALAADMLARVTQDLSAAEAIAAAADGSDGRIQVLRLELQEAELELATLKSRAASVDKLKRDADDAMRAHAAALREHRHASNVVDDCEKRIAQYDAELADEGAVRAAAERKAQLGERWRALVGDQRSAAADLSAAKRRVDSAAVALRQARDRNLLVEDRARLVETLNAAAHRAELLRPLCEAQAQLKQAKAELEREAQRASLSQQIEAANATVAQLDAVLELLVRVGQLQGSVEADEAWARGLENVPCLGAGKYASCSYLTAAVEARSRLDPLRAEAAAAVLALNEADVGLGAATKGAAAVSAELTATRRRLTSLQVALGALPVTDAREVIEARVVELTSAVEAAADACAWEGVEVSAEVAFTAAAKAAEHARAQLTMLPEQAPVDLAPLEAEVARLEAEVEVVNARVVALDADLAVVRADGEQLGALASRLSAVNVAAGSVATELASLPVHRAALDGAVSRLLAADELVKRTSDEWQAAAASSVGGTTFIEAEIASKRAAIAELEVAVATASAARKSLAELTARKLGFEADRRAAALDVSIATTTARFYSEAPALIVENDRAVIEKAANDWLARTSAMSVELVMQRPLKGDSSRVRETLDVDVTRPSGVGVREGCSAGELFRVDIGLAMAIGHAAGSGRSWMVIDEGFGTLKQDVLVAVARELGQVLADLDGLWVVEHNPLIIDQFPVRIVVSPGSNGSTVEIQG